MSARPQASGLGPQVGIVGWLLVLLGGAAAAEPVMRKGPYLQSASATAMTIVWQLDHPADAELVVVGPGGARKLTIPAAPVAHARIDQLVPGSRYDYRITIGGAHWDGTLASSPPDGSPVPYSFLVLGDSRSRAEQHRRVVERAAQEAPDFVLDTGDMVDNGTRDSLWQEFFDIEQPLIRDTPYYPALGNHERYSKTKRDDAYRAYFAVPDDDETGGRARYYAFTYATARVLVLDSNDGEDAMPEQVAWIERELKAARADAHIRHVFCVMHHPIYSVGIHGGSSVLREKWQPLFERYHVSAVFSGHDHAYERADHGGVHYFVTGGAGAPLYRRAKHPSAVDAAAITVFESTLHFLRVSVSGDDVSVTAIRPDGTEIETVAWADH